MFTLILQDERDWRRLPLKAGATSIGRAPTNDVIVGHPSVSRRHARVVVDGGGCQIHDLDSARARTSTAEPSRMRHYGTAT